ncbi:MAG TPA: Do family serine endopeptidase [Spirochaetota bacterium]|nr:Do family serine endopeptidase [Spirochaetota bacterium]HPP48874.1 Do family serine endopeptidase [Spirochaetota bacterium]HXK65238.1 Do family serine endopeptidase [Spirochaetota bacterium]
MKLRIVLITVITFVICTAPLTDAKTVKKAQGSENISDLSKFNEQLVKVTNSAIPTVVSISAEKKAGSPRESKRMPMPFPVPKEAKALGSGVIIDKRGYIVTNNHVVKNTKSITITLFDKRTFPCELVGSDPATDIAVIKISGTVPQDLPVAVMADSDTLKVGEIAIAIGNPFGFGHTVTMGIISATGREGFGLADYEYFIQTDAAINPGNSGGALININGKLIGINTAIFSRNGGYMGIGFAIPSNMVKQVVDELINKGKVTRGWLGVYIQNITPEIAKNFKFEGRKGVLVADIMKDSPAKNAKIEIGDIIISVNGVEVSDINQLRRYVASLKPGSTAKVKIFRGGQELEREVLIAELPAQAQAPEEKMEEVDTIGMRVGDITEENAYKFRITDTTGVIVLEIQEQSPAYEAGMMVGDIIKEIENTPVENVDKYNELLKQYEKKETLLLLVKRGGIHKFVVIKKQ